MELFVQRVLRSNCATGDFVADSSQCPPRIYMVVGDRLEEMRNIPYLEGNSLGRAIRISLRLPNRKIKNLSINLGDRVNVEVSNKVIVEEDGVLTLYKLKDWEENDWLVWDVNQVKVF